MFVRFRAVRHRLVVDLIETSRIDGKVRSEHIARLGSVALPEPAALAERVRFWRELKGRFREIAVRLANRVSPDDRRKTLAAIHARIPKPTEADEQAHERAIEIEKAQADLAYWERQRDSEIGKTICTTLRAMISKCEADLADRAALNDAAEHNIQVLQTRLLKLLRGAPA
jgi:hypothetical protein